MVCCMFDNGSVEINSHKLRGKEQIKIKYTNSYVFSYKNTFQIIVYSIDTIEI